MLTMYMESFTQCTVTLYISETLSLFLFRTLHSSKIKKKTCDIKQTIPIFFQRIRICTMYILYMESLTKVLRVEVEVEISLQAI